MMWHYSKANMGHFSRSKLFYGGPELVGKPHLWKPYHVLSVIITMFHAHMKPDYF